MSISCKRTDLVSNIAQGSVAKPGSGSRTSHSSWTSRICRVCAVVEQAMHGLWLHDIESFEAISQNDDARRIFLRMAALQQAGRLPNFLAEIASDDELDEATKGQLTELASDESFLLAVEEYLRKTQRIH